LNIKNNINFTEAALHPLTPRENERPFFEFRISNKEQGSSKFCRIMVNLQTQKFSSYFELPCSLFDIRYSKKILLLIFTIISFSTCTSPPLSKKEKLLQDATHFLWEKQNADGGWHSETHGILKSGQSVSAFVFYQLLQVPDEIYQPTPEQIEKGLQFLRTHCKDGVLGHFNPIILDYPNYATAYALRILKHFNQTQDQVLIQQMRVYLLSQQFTAQRGFQPNHLAYGAWGFGEKYLEEGHHGHVDLSHTRRILQSLQLFDNQEDSVLALSQYFLSILQKNQKDPRPHPTGVTNDKLKYDGGFFASTVTVSTNKGDITNGENPFYKSYATATADGLLALIASGVSTSDKRVQDAFQWLLDHPELEYPEGIPHDDPNQWHRVMFYYHLSVRAQAYRAMNYNEEWENEIVNILLEKQKKDGSFSNPMGAANKEDDPLIATALVIAGFVN